MKKLKKWTAVLTAAMLACSVPVPAFAASGCEINVELSTDNHSTMVDGAEFTIAEVLDLDNGSYSWCGTYESAGYTQDSVLSGNEKAAEDLAAIAKADTSVKHPSGVTNGGRAYFTGLDDGVWLVYESGKTGAAAGYDDSPSFFVQVPYVDDDGEVQDEITVYPKAVKSVTPAAVQKVSAQPKEEKQTETTPNTQTGKVQTGDETNRNMIVGFSSMAAILLAVGLGLNKQMKKEDRKNREDF